jgi:hypothetical protein
MLAKLDMSNRLKVIGFFSIILCATTAEAKSWRGIVPLYSTRSDVEQLLGPPTAQSTPFSVVYKTPGETVASDFRECRTLECGHE